MGEGGRGGFKAEGFTQAEGRSPGSEESPERLGVWRMDGMKSTYRDEVDRR